MKSGAYQSGHTSREFYIMNKDSMVMYSLINCKYTRKLRYKASYFEFTPINNRKADKRLRMLDRMLQPA